MKTSTEANKGSSTSTSDMNRKMPWHRPTADDVQKASARYLNRWRREHK